MPAWLSMQDALEQALGHIQPINQSQQITLDQACGRTLASPVIAPIDVPPWDNSAMDGYAIKLGGDVRRDISQTIRAGELSQISLQYGDCARIMTGAPIPPGTDAVVIQENVEKQDDQILINKMPDPGANIRPKAGDIAKGDHLFNPGHYIQPQDLMLMSSIGIAKVDVLDKPKVAILATGDELALPGSEQNDNQIFESHRAGLRAKLESLGCDVTDMGIVKDNKDSIVEMFNALAKDHNMVISSGGVSVGDADWVKPALSSLGTLHLWKLAIKPGKPFAFGQFDNCYFCGLPGNPVSAFVTFDQLVTPIIHALRGSNKPNNRLTLHATLSTPLRRRAGRKEFARGVYVVEPDGNISVSLHKKQSSSVMTSLTQANCYVVIDEDSENLSPGDRVKIQPFSLEC